MEVVTAVTGWYTYSEVTLMAIPREHVKVLIDRLTDEQVHALWVILEAMAWPEVDVSAGDEAAIDEGVADLAARRKVRAGDVWADLGL